ncbi:MAG: hypothetical protein KJ971_00005 [Firmicutes bacterium]|nr:hypothetical protein [Bacillota bacterium]
MPDILAIVIPSSSKTGKNGIDYKNYLLAYKSFTLGKRIFAKVSSAKVDSQFSERLAADVFGFDVDHSTNLDGLDPITKETYEVKGTGFSNNTAHFNPNNQADHVIWVKVRNGSIEIREIDTDIYNHLDQRGFVNINKHMNQISCVTYTY